LEKEKKKTDFENLDSFWDTLNHLGKIYNVRHAWTLKKLVRRVKEFTQATTMEEYYMNGSQWVNIFKILTFGPTREPRNLTFDQLGTVGSFKKG